MVYQTPSRLGKPKPSSQQPTIFTTAPAGTHRVRTRPLNGSRKPKLCVLHGVTVNYPILGVCI